MDQLGQVWAELLERILAARYEDALNEFMRLSNASERIAGDEQAVARELQKEAESRLTTALARDVQRLCKQCSSRARNGDTAGYETDVREVFRLLSIRVGVDLVSKHNSGAATTKDCREPVKQLITTLVVVLCAQATSELKHRVELKRKAKNITPAADDGFLDAIEASVNIVLKVCVLCAEAELALSDSPESDRSKGFYPDLLHAIHESGAGQIKQIIGLFLEDRRVKTHWFKRAEELGGLTLPKALSSPSTNTTNTGRAATPMVVLDDTESTHLDLILHETSQILSLCEEFEKSTLHESSLELVTVLVRLDELWLSHNLSKAVSHAVSYEIEPLVHINSIAEDVFHVTGTCFARAVNSLSLFAAEASANNVAGFLANGFCDIMRELLQRDAPKEPGDSDKNGGSSKAATAVASLETRQGTFTKSKEISPMFIEAINTVAAAASYTKDFRIEMHRAFEQTFEMAHAMAPTLLEETHQKLEGLLDDGISTLSEKVSSIRALRMIADHLDPRSKPYDLSVVAFERDKTSWVKNVVDAQYKDNALLRECIQVMSYFPAQKLVERLARMIAEAVEYRLEKLRFNALGALQLDKDVRALCETILLECNEMGKQGDQQRLNVEEDEVRKFDAQVRPQFKRLRHWAFLLSLERAADEKDIPYPGKALSEEEISRVLKKRVEPDF